MSYASGRKASLCDMIHRRSETWRQFKLLNVLLERKHIPEMNLQNPIRQHKPGLAAFESIFWLLLKLRRIHQCGLFQSMDGKQSFSMTVQLLDNKRIKKIQKVQTRCILVFSLHAYTHFGSLRGLLHPGKSVWHVPLSFLTLFDTWNDLGAETRMTSLGPPSVSCGLQSSWHVQLLSPFAWPALPTHKVQNLHQNRNIIYDNLCFLYPRTHQRVIVTWLLQPHLRCQFLTLKRILLRQFHLLAHQIHLVNSPRQLRDPCWKKFNWWHILFWSVEVTYGNIMNHLRVNHWVFTIYPTTRSRRFKHINIKSHISYIFNLNFIVGMLDFPNGFWFRTGNSQTFIVFVIQFLVNWKFT